MYLPTRKPDPEYLTPYRAVPEYQRYEVDSGGERRRLTSAQVRYLALFACVPASLYLTRTPSCPACWLLLLLLLLLLCRRHTASLLRCSLHSAQHLAPTVTVTVRGQARQKRHRTDVCTSSGPLPTSLCLYLDPLPLTTQHLALPPRMYLSCLMSDVPNWQRPNSYLQRTYSFTGPSTTNLTHPESLLSLLSSFPLSHSHSHFTPSPYPFLQASSTLY